ncbi:MAG: hypothetical protein HZA91_00980 [Verrucomicrobia bacterium]|nr:hypothetical protein [Verrucomicrobiota bacterium]
MSRFTRRVGFLNVAGAAGMLGGVLAAAVCFTGCGDPPITAQRVPKEKDPHTAAAAADPHAHGHGVTPPTRAALEWKLPAGWKEATTGRMALATFAIAGEGGAEAQVSVTAMPNIAEHEADIVNMWRQQAGLPALGKEEAKASLQPVEVGGEKGRLFEVATAAGGATGPKRIVTAMAHRSDTSWFYKLTGDAKTVEAQKPAFLEFLKSIRVKEAAAPAEAAAPVAAPPPTPAPAAGSGPKWKVPAPWQTVAAGQMQLAKFAVPARGSAKAEVAVSVFPSDTGGTLANVNRWRGQIGLAPIAEAELPKQITALDPANPQAFLVDLKNNDRQLIAAIVPRGGQWFFYKLLGDAAAVTPEKDAFVAFVKSEP